MDKETLIKVVAMLDARIVEKVVQPEDVWEDGYNQGYIDALSEVSSHLQSAIDADVAAMESATGE